MGTNHLSRTMAGSDAFLPLFVVFLPPLYLVMAMMSLSIFKSVLIAIAQFVRGGSLLSGFFYPVAVLAKEIVKNPKKLEFKLSEVILVAIMMAVITLMFVPR